jgi:hypothetical protein
MPREIKYTITVYTFDELDEKAKDRARDWYRQGALDYEWWDSLYDDAANIGLELTGFDLDRNRHARGYFTQDAMAVAADILTNHGPDCETTKTAKEFMVDISALPADNLYDGDIDDIENEFLHSLLEDYSIMLQHEYEYLMSDESVDETIRANEYTFTIDGKREG